jgi:short-subunit dehydrogenase
LYADDVQAQPHAGKSPASVIYMVSCPHSLPRCDFDCRVIATARRVFALRPLQEAGIQCLQLDVTSDSSVTACIDAIAAKHARIDVLVNNAGMSCLGPVAAQPLAELEAVLATNVVGVVRVTQAVVPLMVRQRSGLIMNIGSVTSTMTTPWSGAYSASKAAVMNLSDALRQEVAPFGIRVTYAMTGAVKTSFADNIGVTSHFERYEQPDSMYFPWAAHIRWVHAATSEHKPYQSH